MRWKAIMHPRLDSLHYSYVVLWLFFFCRTHAKHEKAFWKLPKAIKFWVCDHKTHYICRLWFSSVIFCPWCLYFICWAKKIKETLANITLGWIRLCAVLFFVWVKQLLSCFSHPTAARCRKSALWEESCPLLCLVFAGQEKSHTAVLWCLNLPGIQPKGQVQQTKAFKHKASL